MMREGLYSGLFVAVENIFNFFRRILAHSLHVYLGVTIWRNCR